MVEFLRAYEVDQMQVSAYLAYQGTTDAEWAEVARPLPDDRGPAVWTAWVSDEVASRVQAMLNQ